MQTIELIRRLFAYNEWANKKVLESLKASMSRNTKAMSAFAHLLIAEQTWLKRLLSNEDTTGFNFWQELTLDDCAALVIENRIRYAALFDELSEEKLDGVAVYKNSKGVEYHTSFRDILTHVSAHSVYHRGQVVSFMRANGDAPAYTDYIVFVREKDQGSNING